MRTDYAFEIERALLAPTPRAVRYTAVTRAKRRWAVIAFFLLLGVLLWGAKVDVRQMAVVAVRGKTVTAPVVSKEMHSGKSTTYYLLMDLVTDDYRCIAKESVDRWDYEAATPGERRLVTYLPGRRHVYYFGAVDAARVEKRRVAWTLWLLGGAVAYLVIFGAYEADLRNKARLLRDGLPVVGQIVFRRMIRGKSTTYQLTYAFPATAGLPSSPVRRTVSVPKRVFEAFRVGMPLSVLVDPNGSMRSLPYLLLNQVEIEGAAPPSLPGA
jgi:hypothetical protein